VFAPVVAICRALMHKLSEPVFRAQLLGGAVRVGPAQFADLHALVEECAAVLNLPAPEVYVVNSPSFNAMTFGVERPFIILHSSLVDAFGAGELAYIIGHELGHIKSEHVLYLNAAWFLAQGAAAYFGRIILIPARMALDAWMRKAELTADRAGLLACQDLEQATLALIKLALGSRALLSRINLEEYLRQSEELGRGYGPLAELFETHPFIANRIRELHEFNQGLYQELLAGRTQAAEEVGAQAGPDRATEYLAQALELLSEAGRGGLFRARGARRRALEELTFVRNTFPGTDAAVQAEFYLATVHMHLGNGREALRGFQEFLAAHPDHALAVEAQFSIGYCYDRLLGDTAAATRAYAEYVRRYPEAERPPS
jgi:Zn-dependent protease with chaperone function